MIDILGKLLGSPARVKIMRLFLLNQEKGFENKDIVRRSKVSVGSARRELAHLASLGFIKKKTFTKELPSEEGRKRAKAKKVSGWFLDTTFPYLTQMTELLIDAEFLHKEDLIMRFKIAGKLKLLVISGIFLKDSESRVDLLVVGDKLKRPYIENVIKNIEAEIGKELSYAIFETEDFIYRVNMYDKLVRDILDFPHERLVEAKELSTRLVQNS
jgi:hypothetical protein